MRHEEEYDPQSMTAELLRASLPEKLLPKGDEKIGAVKMVTGSDLSIETVFAISDMLDISSAIAVFMAVVEREAKMPFPVHQTTISVEGPHARIVIAGDRCPEGMSPGSWGSDGGDPRDG